MDLHIKLKEVLSQRGMTQKQLVELTGLRANAISEMANNQRQTINKEQLTKVCEALKINNVDEILEFK